MRTAFAALTAALLAGASAPALAQPAAAPLDASIPSDLERNASPSHYRIHIVPDMANLAFSGSASINLQVFEPSEAITLQAVDIDFLTISLVPLAGGAPVALAVAGTDEVKQTVRLAPVPGAPQSIAAGQYRLDMTYYGKIYTQANGLFALDYADKQTGEDRRGLFTQFQAPDARRFAPMFDEPAYKATFDLTATVPADMMAVSNMPVANEAPASGGKKTVTFATTPKMSSYLLFFALGDFERYARIAGDGTDIAIIAPPGSGDQTGFVLDATSEMMPYLADYFGVPYSLPKLDNVTGPGGSQFFAAMENWGAIFSFEPYVLYDPATSSPAAKNFLYVVTAHEVAHQWFGDLVTMQWWDDLWLNEGFASWMENKVTSHFNPDWKAEMSVIGSREAAMALDSLASTHPVVQEITTVGQLGTAFDAITYQKGQAVITMLENYAGEDVWRDGLRAYMREHAYSNTTSADLWRAVEAAGAQDLTGIALDFTTQPGIPLVKVTSAVCENGKTRLSLTQSEFSRDRMAQTAADPQSWRVPLRPRIGAGPTAAHVLEGTGEITLDGCGPVIVNGGQRGYYRTLYSPEMLATLTENFAQLTSMDQYGLMRDNIELSRAGYQPLAVGLSMLAAVPADAEGILPESVVNRWGEFYDLLEGEDAAKLAGMVSTQWQPRLEQLGFAQKDGELLRDSQLRAALIRHLGEMGNPLVLAEANRLAAALAEDRTALDGPLKSEWLRVIARNATPAQWELLRQTGKASTSSVERELFYESLGDTRDPALAQRTLDLALSDEPGKTVSPSILARTAISHPELAWDFVTERMDEVDQLVDVSGRAGFFGRLFNGGESAELLAAGEAFRDSLPVDQRAAMEASLAALKNRLESNPKQRAALTAWLAEQ